MNLHANNLSVHPNARAPWRLLEDQKSAEVIAALRVLVFFAKAQGQMRPEEKAVLEDLFENLVVPGCPDLEQLMNERINLDEQLEKIKSADGRDNAFNAAFCLAHVDGECSSEQQKLLDQIRAGLHISEEKATLLGRVYADARDWLVPGGVNPIAETERRASAINEHILKYSIINAVPGSMPIPVLSILTDLLVISVQVKLVRDIGQYWGHKVDKQAARSIMASILGATSLRVAVHAILNIVPIFGSAFGAASAFGTTWALGKVANKYFESNGKLDAQALRVLYRSAKEEAVTQYEKHKTAIAERIRHAKSSSSESKSNISETTASKK